MKFDYIIQNPPYKGSYHLKFFHFCLNLLNENGKLTIIEPATWLINIRKTGKSKQYSNIKQQIQNHTKQIIINNYNQYFNTTISTPFSITYIDKSQTYDTITFNNFNTISQETSIYNCNLIGNYNIIHSILNKISLYDKISNHITTQQLTNYHYLLTTDDIISSPANLYFIRPVLALSDSSYFKHKYGYYFQSYINPFMHYKRNNISKTIHKKAARGGSTKNKIKLTNVNAPCIYDTKSNLLNYKHNVSNLYIYPFIAILLVTDVHSSFIRDYTPYLSDKKYTDEEVYKLFNLTKDEINLIENSVKKFERNSPWFKTYMTGK